MISGYNGQAPPVKNIFQILAKRLKVFGILVLDFHAKYEEAFYKTVGSCLTANP